MGRRGLRYSANGREFLWVVDAKEEIYQEGWSWDRDIFCGEK